MPAWNPRTAYANEWQYIEGIEDGVVHQLDADGKETGTSWEVKCLRQTVAESYLANLAADNGINPADTLITIWQKSANDPPPTSPNALTIGSTRWIIQRVIAQQQGPTFGCIVGNPLTGNRFGQF